MTAKMPTGQHHGEARALGRVLSEACKGHHGGHQNEAAANAHKARGDASKRPMTNNVRRVEGSMASKIKIQGQSEASWQVFVVPVGPVGEQYPAAWTEAKAQVVQHRLAVVADRA